MQVDLNLNGLAEKKDLHTQFVVLINHDNNINNVINLSVRIPNPE